MTTGPREELESPMPTPLNCATLELLLSSCPQSKLYEPKILLNVLMTQFNKKSRSSQIIANNLEVWEALKVVAEDVMAM